MKNCQMGLLHTSFFFFFILAILSAAVAVNTGTPCDTCYRHSKAAFLTAAASAGACGYGSTVTNSIYAGRFSTAAAAPSIYNEGAFCGACYSIKCMNKDLCSKIGTTVVVTDLHKQTSDNTTDFVISSRGYRAMANRGMDRKLMKLGVVDIEYKRVACVYKNQNLAIQVANYSNPNYLAITVLYQAGQTEIRAIDIAKVGEGASWTMMTRDYGAVWHSKTVPSNGPIQMRFLITSGFDGKTIWAKNVLPDNWKPGSVYNTGVQFNDEIDIGACYPCEARHPRGMNGE